MSDFLFARPSFLAGMARTLDLGAHFDSYNISRAPQVADTRAIYNDWRVVGEELLAALAQLKAEHSEPTTEDAAEGRVKA